MTTYAGIFEDRYTDRRGNAVPGAVVTILESDGVTEATLFADKDRADALANPLPLGVVQGDAGLDAEANGIFYAEVDDYIQEVTVGGSVAYRGPAIVRPHPDEPAGGGGGAFVSLAGDDVVTGAKLITFTPSEDGPSIVFDELPDGYTPGYDGPAAAVRFYGGTGGTPGEMPYHLSAYIGHQGQLYAGVELVVSNKRIDIDGEIQGVSALADGSEPTAISISPDVNGPALASESRALGGGNTNTVSFAAYDQSDIIVGTSTAYSPGFGKKKMVIDGAGGMVWGDDLGVDPLAQGELFFGLVPNSGGYGRFRPGLILEPLEDDFTPLVVRGVVGQSANLIEVQGSDFDEKFVVTPVGGVIIDGDFVCGGWVTSTVFAGPAGAFQLRGNALNVSLGTANVPFTVLGFAGQTGNLTEYQNSASVVLSKITAAGEFEMVTADKGIILKSANGTRYRVTVSNAGALQVVAA